jgi:predicted metal-dependent hydrolase
MSDDLTRLPSALRRFLELYGTARYWDSHEALEGEWRRTGSDFYQALILYASAWVHWKRGNAHGVRAQLKKTLERLADYPTAYLGLDVAALREHCLAVRLEVAQNTDNWPLRVAALPLLLSPDRLRGDEVEIEDYRQAEPDAVTGPLGREDGPPTPPPSSPSSS